MSVLKVKIPVLCGLHSSPAIPGILIVGGESTSDTAELFMPTIGLHCSLPDLPADHHKAHHTQVDNLLLGGYLDEDTDFTPSIVR